MRQTYEVIGGPDVGRASLPLLRAALKEAGLDGLYIPHDDEYQNEYLPACNERLAWATGFTGSAGAAFVFQKSAIVFVDGRYTLQVKQQLAPKLFEVGDLVDPGAFGHAEDHERRDGRIDPAIEYDQTEQYRDQPRGQFERQAAKATCPGAKARTSSDLGRHVGDRRSYVTPARASTACISTLAPAAMSSLAAFSISL